jgi:hypothetical protein
MINITHLRIKPLALARGHGRYITVTPERTFVSVGEWPLHSRYKFLTVSLPKRFLNGRLTSETATWIQKYFQKSVGASRALDTTVFQGGDDGRGYRNMYKIPRGPTRIKGTDVCTGMVLYVLICTCGIYCVQAWCCVYI